MEDRKPDAIALLDTAVNEAVANLTSRLSERSATAMADVAKQVGDELRSLDEQVGIETQRMDDLVSRIVQGWSQRQAQVSGSAQLAVRSIEATAERVEEVTEKALDELPARIATLERSVVELSNNVGTTNIEMTEQQALIDKSRLELGEVRYQLGVFAGLESLLKNNEIVRFEIVQPALTVLKHTVAVAGLVLFLSVILSLGLSRLSARRVARTASQPPESCPNRPRT